MAMKDEINLPLVGTVGIVSVLLLAVLVLGTVGWYEYETQSEFARKWGGVTSAHVVEVKKSQQAVLTAPPAYVDRAGGVVRIPIDQAMRHIATSGGKLPTTRP